MIKFIVIALASFLLYGCHNSGSGTLGACLKQAKENGLPESVCYPKLSPLTPIDEHHRHQATVMAATQPLPILQQVVAKTEQVAMEQSDAKKSVSTRNQAETSKMIDGVLSGRYQMTILKTNVYRIVENGKTVCKIAELGEVPCAKFNWPKQ